MAQTQTQVSLKNIGNFATSTTQGYDVVTNRLAYSEMSIGTSGISNIVPVSGAGSATTTATYGLLYLPNNVYGTNGNMLYRYSTTNSAPGITTPGTSCDVTTLTGSDVFKDTSIPGYSTQTNNYNTTSLPITVSGSNSITATSSPSTVSYTVTSVFGTNIYLDTDGTNIYALLPDSRIIKIVPNATLSNSTVSVVTTIPILSSFTTTPSYGLAYLNGYLYAFDGSDGGLKYIDPTAGTFTILPGLNNGNNTYGGFVYYPSGSILAAYPSPSNSINYLFVGSYNATNYYSIDVLQFTAATTTTLSTPPTIAFKYPSVYVFQEKLISITQFGGTLYTLSTNAPYGTTNYNSYQLSITISGAPICFLKGTYIYTKEGYRQIETLKKGDLVNTFKDNYVPIDTIVEEEMYHDAKQERNKCQLFKLSYPEYPQLLKELYITGAHSILVGKLTDTQKEKIIQDYGKVFATDLFDRLPAYLDEKAKVHDESGKYTIYHLALENENNFSNYGIFANGLLVESLSKNDCVNRLF